MKTNGCLARLKSLPKKAKKLPLVLAKNGFLFLLIMLFLELLLGAVLFWRYKTLAENSKPQATETLTQFDEKTYRDVLNIWQGREARLEQTDKKTYINPFKPSRP